MDTLKRKVNNRNQVYKIYTAEEADKLNITYLHWKEAHIGDYALSDDGYVGKCIGRKTYTDKKGFNKWNIGMSPGQIGCALSHLKIYKIE